MAVNPKHVLSPADLRAYLARHRIRAREIAEMRGTSRAAVSLALFADSYGRPISQRLLRELLDVANDILLKREQELALCQ